MYSVGMLVGEGVVGPVRVGPVSVLVGPVNVPVGAPSAVVRTYRNNNQSQVWQHRAL